MKRFIFVILAVLGVIYLTGCGKKQASLEEMQQPLSIEESLLMSPTAAPAASETPAVDKQLILAVPASEAKLTLLPPPGPYKPTAQEIQTALKNAGYYTGAIDAKIGPQTKKAIQEFQKANGLAVDGKVGPKTWAVLNRYLKKE